MLMIEADAFETPAELPALAQGDVHVWLIACAQSANRRALSANAHAELGRLLAHYSGIDQPVALARTEFGKPYAIQPGYPQFNLSHGGQRIALAFARDHAIGVDVEAVQRRHSSLDLAERFFATEEAQALAALAPPERQQAFVNLWTCKEAVLKALGRGIAFGLDRLRFTFDGVTPLELVEIAAEGGVCAQWNVHRFDAGAGHAGALAWHGKPLRVRAFKCVLDAAPMP
ncbi:MAG: 4'-phosphopantetheinyl transferase superfamily protein [Dokdonella sp.]